MAISNIWTIKGATGTFQSFAALNLFGLNLRDITQAADEARFTQAGAYDAEPLFAYGETVTIQRDGVQWFKGTCTAVKRSGSASAERIQYCISGPWWQLKNIIYQQEFNRYVGGVLDTPELAKLVLGSDENGDRLHSGQVITAAVDYAIAALGSAALFQRGTIDGTTEMPFEELSALSCAEVISRVLRWNPDIVAYFDYTTTTPTLHLRRRSALASATLAHSSITISENSINPLDELQRDGVVIQFEQTDTIDGVERKTATIESAGTTSDPLKTLYLFFDLQGASASFIRQTIVSETIQESSAAWWAKRHPKLQAATGISVANSTKTPVDDGGQNDGTSYSKELISGSVAEWMLGVGACSQIIEAEVTYTPSGGTQKTETLRLQIQGTNANSSTYSVLNSATPAEPKPTGLAADILSGLATLQYEGTVTLTEQEVGVLRYIARTINISGGRTEWATMSAQVYQVNYDVDSGITRINFGPARHLSANDLFQLYRNTRTRKPAGAFTRVSTGGSANDLPTRSPNTLTADDGGGAAGESYGSFLIYLADGSSYQFDAGYALYGYDPDTDDDWCLEFDVSSMALDSMSVTGPDSNGDYTATNPTGAATDATGANRFDGDASSSTAQTYVRIPIVADGEIVCLGGTFRENIFCAGSKGGIVELIKIG
jgi:hypothetical protein